MIHPPLFTAGYYQFPHLFQDRVIFVSEGDIWQVPALGGRAERLTCGMGAIHGAVFSPDGAWIAYSGTEEGAWDIYLMPGQGGPGRRLTFLDHKACVIGWTDQGHVVFTSTHATPFASLATLYTVCPESGMITPLNLGPANGFDQSPEGLRVIQRHGYGYVTWKGYRGGAAGELWVEKAPHTGEFQKILSLDSNTLNPCWQNGRVYFLSDHEGRGRVYSCTASGEDVRCHTQALSSAFYVTQLRRSGTVGDTRLIFKHGADLFILDTDTDSLSAVEIHYPSHRPHRARRFVSPTQNLTAYAPSPDGQAVLLTTRGRLFGLPPVRGPVLQYGLKEGVRYRGGTWLSKNSILAVRDGGDEEYLDIFSTTQPETPSVSLNAQAWGRILEVIPSPQGEAFVLTNHRHELWHVSLPSGEGRLLDRSPYGPFQGVDWSPDGKWVVYGVKVARACGILRLCQVERGETHDITSPLAEDFAPRFDPKGRFIYFLSFRTFTPVKDPLRFDFSFAPGIRPYLLTLHKDTPSPFVLPPEAFSGGDGEDAAHSPETPPLETTTEISPHEAPEAEDGGKGKDASSSSPHTSPSPTSVPLLTIDLDGIAQRILPFPVPPGHYTEIWAWEDKVYWIQELPDPHHGEESAARKKAPTKAKNTPPASHDHLLQMYDLATFKLETLAQDAVSMIVARQGQWLMYATPEHKLRLIKAGEKPEEEDKSYRAGGWIDEDRVRLEIYPAREWHFMFDEAWRLQKDLFWSPEMGDVDWDDIGRRYRPLVDRVNTVAELMDLIADMQGELRVSHAYTWGYDRGSGVSYTQGQLGGSFTYCLKTNAWVLEHLDTGDVGNPEAFSPLRTPGLDITVGTRLWAIDGTPLTQAYGPSQALVNKAETYVGLVISPPPAVHETASPETPLPPPEKISSHGEDKRTVWVKTLADSAKIRYRDWVNRNRKRVHDLTQGQVGYIHIPDMGNEGFGEFFRSYMSEFDKKALVVDVRYNGGGSVSTLLLSVLCRKRLGYDQSRWEGQMPYLTESPAGPMVALCNEMTGSDGDMFAYSFQKLTLGPLIGKRTWGGVIGIFPRHPLLDGTMTSQPEYAIWFHDIGWSLENKGATPDIVVENTPQDDAHGLDVQLDRGIQEALALLPPEPGG